MQETEVLVNGALTDKSVAILFHTFPPKTFVIDIGDSKSGSFQRGGARVSKGTG